MRLTGWLIGACMALCAAATCAQALPASEEVARFSAFRVAHGFPPVSEDPALSRGCALHNAYQARNNVFGHDEDPALPGYTYEGASAGGASILSSGGPTFGDGVPFAQAPIHFAQMMAPTLEVTGIDATAPYYCLQTLASADRVFDAPRLFVYPSEGSVVAPAENAAESPFVPGDLVGLPMGTTTGPHLYVFGVGALASGGRGGIVVPEARLTGPEGAVPVEVVTSATERIGGYLPAVTAIVIPRRPLRARAEYVATVSIAGGDTSLSRTWTFRTEGTTSAMLGEPRLTATGLEASLRVEDPETPSQVVAVRATIRSGATTRALGSRALTGPGGTSTTTRVLRWSRSTPALAGLAPGTWTLAVEVLDAQGATLARSEQTVGVRPAPKLRARARLKRGTARPPLVMYVRASAPGRLTIARPSRNTTVTRTLHAGLNAFTLTQRQLGGGVRPGARLFLRHDAPGAVRAHTTVRVERPR